MLVNSGYLHVLSYLSFLGYGYNGQHAQQTGFFSHTKKEKKRKKRKTIFQHFEQSCGSFPRVTKHLSVNVFVSIVHNMSSFRSQVI